MEWFLLLNCSISSIIVCLGHKDLLKAWIQSRNFNPWLFSGGWRLATLLSTFFFYSGLVWKDTLTVSNAKDDSSSCRKGCCCCRSLIHFAQSFISRSGPPCGKVGIEESLIHSVASPFGPFQSVCNLKSPSGWSLEIGSGQHTQGAQKIGKLCRTSKWSSKAKQSHGEVQEAMVGLGTSFRPIAGSS